jgi:hypothetical protein
MSTPSASLPRAPTTTSSPRRRVVLYWSTTSLVAVVMIWSALNFSLHPAMKGAFAHLGLPDWFRVELTIAKLLGALALVIPGVPRRIKEFAYFGFGLTLVSATIAHLSSGDGLKYEAFHSFFFVCLVISYRLFERGVPRHEAAER